MSSATGSSGVSCSSGGGYGSSNDMDGYTGDIGAVVCTAVVVVVQDIYMSEKSHESKSKKKQTNGRMNIREHIQVDHEHSYLTSHFQTKSIY